LRLVAPKLWQIDLLSLQVKGRNEPIPRLIVKLAFLPYFLEFMAREQHIHQAFVQREVLLGFSEIVQIVRVFEFLLMLKILDLLEGCFVPASQLFDHFSVCMEFFLH